MSLENITNKDWNELADLITNTQYFAAYPKRLRVNTNKNNTAGLKDLLNKYWSNIINKSEIGGTGKERYVRTYHNSKSDRDKLMSDVQQIKRSGRLDQLGNGFVEDQNGNLRLDDNTIREKEITLTDQIQSLFSGISNTAIIIGGLIIIGIIFFVTRKKKQDG